MVASGTQALIPAKSATAGTTVNCRGAAQANGSGTNLDSFASACYLCHKRCCWQTQTFVSAFGVWIEQ